MTRMMYRLIHKDPKNQPTSGVYNDPEWKEQIAKECYCQCVYCTVHESQWGGIDHYHIDHFRPKSLPRFAALENDICNLFYCCPVCNRFKGNDWPADPDLNIPSYPDPSITNYDTIFDFDFKHYTITGKNVSASYVILKLYLNRPQLVYERRELILREKEMSLFEDILIMVSQVQEKEILSEALKVIGNIKRHLIDRQKIRPYKLSEIKKP